jgi:transmembrane sensor
MIIMNEAERIGNLFFLYLRKELSPAEEKELIDWRQSSPQHEQEFRTAVDPENIRTEIKHINESRDRVFQKLKERYPGIWKMKVVNSRTRFYRFARIAAIVLVVLGTGIYFLRQRSNEIHPAGYTSSMIFPYSWSRFVDDTKRGREIGQTGSRLSWDEKGDIVWIAVNDTTADKNKYNTIRSPRGEYFSVLLPNGTHVWLNVLSKLKYPQNFKQDTIRLFVEGQIYIEAKHDSLHTLFISLPADPDTAGSKPIQLEVESRTASYSILKYANERFVASLMSGSLRVQSDSGRWKVYQQLLPGQQIRESDENHLTILKTDTSKDLAWKKGRLLYDSTDIQTIMNSIGRWYDVDVVFQGAIPEKRYSLNMSANADIRDVLAALRKQGGIQTSIIDRTIFVEP